MRRLLCLLLGLLPALPCQAAEPGQRVEMQWAFRGFGPVAEFSQEVEEAGVGHHRREVAAVGLAWRQDGWKVSATGGRFAYDITGAGQGAAPHASFAVGYELATARAGTLSFEVRQTAVWQAEQRLDESSVRLGWRIGF